jgi:NAD-dependent dihydropyrimidine dehydrogenase PreA subunit
VLAPRVGYCDYSCNACGTACPTRAIPELPLEEKRVAVIGVAHIDEERCIPYAEGRDCIVCEEMCPVPKKAVVLEEKEVVTSDGTTTLVRQPKVVEKHCTGCGICEHQCPLNGEAAIRIEVMHDVA